MKTDIEKKVDELINKSIIYKKEIVKIQTYKLFPSGNLVINFVGGTSINLDKNLIKNFFEEILLDIPENFTPLSAEDFLDEKPAIKQQFEKTTIQTTKKEIKMETEKNKENEIVERKSNSVPAEKFSDQVTGYAPTEENLKVKSALLDMLDKVTRNPAHIAQAKAVCDIANTMVNIQKNEISLIQMMKKSK